MLLRRVRKQIMQIVTVLLKGVEKGRSWYRLLMTFALERIHSIPRVPASFGVNSKRELVKVVWPDPDLFY